MELAGSLEFNNQGTILSDDNIKRAKDAASGVIKYIIYKKVGADEVVENGFEAGQVHKCTVYHNVIPRIADEKVAETKGITRSFCCIGFGVRKTGNEGTIEQ